MRISTSSMATQILMVRVILYIIFLKDVLPVSKILHSFKLSYVYLVLLIYSEDNTKLQLES